MTEITDANLFKIFAGEQNLDNMRFNGDNIIFFVGRFDIDSEQIETYPCSITRNDLMDIKNVFTSLRSLPATEYLLLMLWIREVKFKTDSLLEFDRIDFVQNAFTLNGINIDTEKVVWEFHELLHKGYISEGITEVEEDFGEGITEVEQIKDYFLSSEGKRVAEEKFEAIKMLVNDHLESPPISQEISNDMRQVIVGTDRQILDRADTNATTQTLTATLRKGGEKTDYDYVIRTLFEQRPETKTFSSVRLLLYLRDFARQKGIEITIQASRIRQLPVWTENARHRKSGKTQYRGDMGDAADKNAVDVNSDTYEMVDN
jgi:hypothetical protein